MQEQDLQHTVARLRAQGTDDEHVEVKASAGQLSKDIWESVSAFANTSGGLILLGLDEKDGFKPVKRFAVNKVLDQFVSGMGDGDPQGARISQAPSYHPHRLVFEGSPVLAIDIDELDADKKPCYITGRGVVGGSYKRIDDKDVRLSPTEIYSLKNFLTPSRADRRPIQAATTDDLSSSLVNDLLNREKDSRALQGARTKKAQMARLNLIDENGNVTLAGLLSCGNYPQQFFPKFVVDVAVHPGVQKSDPAASTRFLDRAVCEGPIGEVVDAAYRAIVKNLRTYSIVRGAGRVDELEIPGEVLREALANAVVHREYGEYFEGRSVSVDIYPDRVEITNPGGLWGGKTLENIGDGTSACRNPALMKLMSLMPLPSGNGAPTEGNGSGVPLMRSVMRSRALKEPEFSAGIDFFKVVLNRSGAEIDENRQWLDRTISADLDAHERAIAVIVRRAGRASVRSVRDELGIDSDEIRSAFGKLVENGVAKWTGDDEIELAERSLPARKPRWSKQEWYSRIKESLSPDVPRTIHDVATAVGRDPANVRTYMKELVSKGDVIATAPPSSINRKYLLKQ